MKAYALFDTGSTGDLMAPEFSFVSRSPTFKLTEEVPLQLGCKGSRSKVISGVRVDATLGETKIKDVYFDIANIDRYDAILGIPFMWENNILLDVRERIIRIGGANGQVIKAIAPGEEQQLLSEREVKRRSKTQGKERSREE